MDWNPLYWNPRRTRSYNCLFNFIIGMRGAGKTYGALLDCIQRYLDGRGQFMYLRRIKTELEKLTTMRGGRLFNAVQKEFPQYEVKAESNILSIRRVGDKKWQTMGYSQPLSTASILKSDAIPDITTIIFDEFIIDNSGTYHYLKDEVRKFLDLYETVARGRDVIVFFISNAVTVSNPYFDFWNLNKPYHTDIQRFGASKDILVENVEASDLSAIKKKSRFGQLIAGTEYSDYAYDNKWLLDNTDFVCRKTGRSQYFVTLIYKGRKLGIWVDRTDWLWWVSDSVDVQCNDVYSVTTNEHKPNVMLFNAGKRLGWLKTLIEAYECGAVRYESVKLKNTFRDIMRMAAGVR